MERTGSPATVPRCVAVCWLVLAACAVGGPPRHVAAALHYSHRGSSHGMPPVRKRRSPRAAKPRSPGAKRRATDPDASGTNGVGEEGEEEGEQEVEMDVHGRVAYGGTLDFSFRSFSGALVLAGTAASILDDCRTAFVDGVCACVRFVLACRWRLNGTERVVLAPVVTPWHAWRAQEGCRSGWVRTRRLDAALRSSRCPSSASILHAHGMGAAAAGWSGGCKYGKRIRTRARDL
ncbi:MAG: hypothetical protein ACPIOQ_40640 [Promethearchaeia archaeon]